MSSLLITDELHDAFDPVALNRGPQGDQSAKLSNSVFDKIVRVLLLWLHNFK